MRDIDLDHDHDKLREPDEESHHRFVLNKQTNQITTWSCPTCGRTVQLDRSRKRFRIIRPGNALVNHGSASTSPALRLDAAQIPPPDQLKALH